MISKSGLIFIFLSGVFGTSLLLAEEDAPPMEPPYVQPSFEVEKSLEQEVQAVQESYSPPAVQSNALTTNINENQVPQFVKPPGPAKGGVLKVPHPNAAKGLLRINKDGSYQYRVAIRPKSKSSSLRLGSFTSPKIAGVETSSGNKSFKDYYGGGGVVSALLDYEWQPFTHFGRLGLQLGTGFATARGNGYFKTKQDESQAPEVYNLYIIPISAFLVYRFEYVRRQWVVPYLKGGGTYFGLAEVRDDNTKPIFAGAPAVGGGGGLHFSISALDPKGAFTLDREYGIADMYFTLEAMALQGLKSDIDFTTQVVNAGITIDF